MTKAEYKRRKDKLLIARNTARSSVRLGKKDTIDLLRARFSVSPETSAGDLIKLLNENHERQLASLDEEFKAATKEKATIGSLKPVPVTSPSVAPDDRPKTTDALVSVARDYGNEPDKDTKRRRSDSWEDIKPKYLSPERDLKARLKIWQRDASDWLRDNIMLHNRSASFLRSGTGTGKTFMIGDLIQQLHDSGWITQQRPTPTPVLYVTAATVVEKTIRELESFYGLQLNHEYTITNYEQLRAGFGSEYIQTKKRLTSDGDYEIYYEWIPFISPLLIIWDEAHKLKNESSTQHKIAMAVSRLPDYSMTYQVSMSATPWTRISDCKHFAIAAKIEIEGREEEEDYD